MTFGEARLTRRYRSNSNASGIAAHVGSYNGQLRCCSQHLICDHRLQTESCGSRSCACVGSAASETEARLQGNSYCERASAWSVISTAHGASESKRLTGRKRPLACSAPRRARARVCPRARVVTAHVPQHWPGRALHQLRQCSLQIAEASGGAILRFDS